MLAHSAKDPIVDIKYGRTTRDMLKKWGLEVKWKEFPSEGHGVPDLYWKDVLAYLSQTLRDGVAAGETRGDEL